MARVAFAFTSSRFDGNALRSRPLGGAESVTVQLAEALAARGHEVTVVTASPDGMDISGVAWRPARKDDPVNADVAVANSSANELRYIAAPRRVVWIHNTRAFDRFLRKGGAWATFRHLPEAVVLGPYHSAEVSRFIPYRRRVMIPHAVGEPFTTAAPATAVPPPRALHFSQPHRDAQNLVRIWVEQIHPRLPEARFHLLCGDWEPDGFSRTVLEVSGIILRPRANKQELVAELRLSRVMLYRGHRDETFCLAAAEAIAMGVPVVTQGIGALRERVRHGETGFIAPSDQEFADGAIRLLTDNPLWSKCHDACLATRADSSWDRIAQMWERAFLT